MDKRSYMEEVERRYRSLLEQALRDPEDVAGDCARDAAEQMLGDDVDEYAEKAYEDDLRYAEACGGGAEPGEEDAAKAAEDLAAERLDLARRQYVYFMVDHHDWFKPAWLQGCVYCKPATYALSDESTCDPAGYDLVLWDNEGRAYGALWNEFLASGNDALKPLPPREALHV